MGVVRFGGVNRVLRDHSPGLRDRTRRSRSDPDAAKRFPRLRVGRSRLLRYRNGWDYGVGFVLTCVSGIVAIIYILRFYALIP